MVANAVLMYVLTPSPTVAICAYVPPEPVLRSILNPDSFVELSAQERLICVLVAATAANELGSPGRDNTTETLSNTAVVRVEVLWDETASPICTVAAMVIVVLPTCVQVTPSLEE